VVNFVAQDLAPEEPTQEDPEGQQERTEVREGAYVSRLDKENLRQMAMEIFQKKLGQEIKNVSQSLYETKDGQTAISYAASKPYPKPAYTGYWFAFHDYNEEFMKKHLNGFVAYHCTGEGTLMIPWVDFSKHLSSMGETTYKGRHWRHVIIKHLRTGVWEMKLRANTPGNPVDISSWVVPIGNDAK